MKILFLLGLTFFSYNAFAETYNCDLSVKNNRVNLKASVVFNGNTIVSTTIDSFTFEVFRKTLSNGEDAVVISARSPYQSDSTFFAPGSEWAALAFLTTNNDTVRAICRIQ